MNSTYKEQIQAIQFALSNLKRYGFHDRMTENHLNDACSTIAALNLTKDVPKDNPEFRINELEDALKSILKIIEDNKFQLWLNDNDQEQIKKTKTTLIKKFYDGRR